MRSKQRISWETLAHVIVVALATTLSGCGGSSIDDGNAQGGSAGLGATQGGGSNATPTVCGVTCPGTVACSIEISGVQYDLTGIASEANGACVLDIHPSNGTGTTNVLTCDHQLNSTDNEPDQTFEWTGTWTGSGSTVTLTVEERSATCTITP